jgi:hypothetical protein
MGKTVTALHPVGNGAKEAIAMESPYVVFVTIEGSASLLFHRWDNEAIEEKAKARKNSKAKKEDNIESYVYRNEAGEICIPGEYLRQAIIHAAKFKQDPRSPRKSAADLFKAGVVSLTELASMGVKEWDYLDRRRVMVQRQGITRTRPAMQKGWRASFDIQVLTPEYIDASLLHEVLTQAGRLIGIGDFRPSFGRFFIVSFEVNKEVERE